MLPSVITLPSLDAQIHAHVCHCYHQRNKQQKCTTNTFTCVPWSPLTMFLQSCFKKLLKKLYFLYNLFGKTLSWGTVPHGCLAYSFHTGYKWILMQINMFVKDTYTRYPPPGGYRIVTKNNRFSNKCQLYLR